MSGVVRRLADNTSGASVATNARRKRFAEMLARFPELPDMRVLDLGGTLSYWHNVPLRPRHVTLVNLDATPDIGDGYEVLRADACDLPTPLRERSFDLTMSNSLIEHVGGHERRIRFAEQVRASASHYWVQTPYRYFPIEPHWVFPGQQFLPARGRIWLSQRWKGGHVQSTPDTAPDDVLWIELLSVTELRHYFPDADIYRERFCGITKSITAVR